MWGDLLFVANDLQSGHELFKLRNGATATPRGEGYGSAARPLPRLDSTDPVLGKTAQIKGTSSSGSGSFVFTIAGVPDYTPTLLPGTRSAYVYTNLALPIVILDVSQPHSGGFGFSFAIPGDSGLLGLRLSLQSWVLFTDSPKGFDLSNGLSWWVGR